MWVQNLRAPIFDLCKRSNELIKINLGIFPHSMKTKSIVVDSANYKNAGQRISDRITNWNISKRIHWAHSTSEILYSPS